jgi:hypothetical protein
MFKIQVLPYKIGQLDFNDKAVACLEIFTSIYQVINFVDFFSPRISVSLSNFVQVAATWKKKNA